MFRASAFTKAPSSVSFASLEDKLRFMPPIIDTGCIK